MSKQDESYEELKERIEREESREKLESLKKEEFEEIYEDKKSVIRNKVDREGKHLEMIKAVSSAFIPEGSVAKSTGYNFLFTEPLVEENEPNFDVLLYNQESSSVCLVECKSSLNRRNCKEVLDDVNEAIKSSKKRKKYLKRQIGGDISHFEYILMTSAADLQELRGYCDNNNHDAIEKISVWYPDFFEESKINLERDFGKNDHSALNNAFSNSGIQFNKERTDIDLIYESHPLTFIKQVLIEIVFENMKNESNDLKEFDEERISESLNKKWKIGASGKNRAEMIDKKTDMIIELGKSTEIIKQGKNTDYRVVSRYESIPGIRDNIEEKYIENRAEDMAEEEAKENAVRRFKKDVEGTQSGLGSFSN